MPTSRPHRSLEALFGKLHDVTLLGSPGCGYEGFCLMRCDDIQFEGLSQIFRRKWPSPSPAQKMEATSTVETSTVTYLITWHNITENSNFLTSASSQPTNWKKNALYLIFYAKNYHNGDFVSKNAQD
jgi:hypothetical protein